MLKANLAQQNAPKPSESSNKQMFDGMKDDDIPNVAELRREWNQREAAYQERLEELQIQQMYPDYAEVIEKYALPLVKQKPHLAQGIPRSSQQSVDGSMNLERWPSKCKHLRLKPRVNENAQRIVDNAKKPGTLSRAGGQAALSKADYFASMSDKEFIRFASRNLEGI